MKEGGVGVEEIHYYYYLSEDGGDDDDLIAGANWEEDLNRLEQKRNPWGG